MAGAAALPAISLPAMADPTDPIFAAIEKHRPIRAEYERASAEFDRVHKALPRSNELRRLEANREIFPCDYPADILAERERIFADPEYVRAAIIQQGSHGL